MAVSHKNGIALTGVSAINGITSLSAINGFSATLGPSGPGLVSSIYGGAAGTFTTSAINATGANLIVVGITRWVAGGAPNVITDSEGNTYTSLTAYGASSSARLYYCSAPTVSGSMTFTNTCSGGNVYGAIFVAALSGMSTSSVFDAEVGASSGSWTSFAASALTPGQANTYIVTMLSFDENSTATIPSGYTSIGSIPNSSSNYLAGGMAIKQLLSTTPETPTWTVSPSAANGGIANATFKF